MESLLVVVFPVLLMLFALSMERVESRLKRLSVEEDEVEEFLDSANPAEVNTFVREGLPRALTMFRLRRRTGRRPARKRPGRP
ncbi:hypothetical protein GCM10027047_25700 [Rhodococcus aerolatus]